MADSLQAWRDAAVQQFRTTGLPHERQEDWKYTDISDIHSDLGADWRQPALVDDTAELPADYPCIGDLDAYRIVIYRGRIHAASDALPSGVSLTFWSDMDEQTAVERLPAVDTSARLFHAFEALNAARMQDGLCLRMAAHVVLDRPLYVLHLHDSSAHAHVRHSIHLGTGAKADVIAHDVALDEGTARLRSSHWQFTLEAQSHASFSRVQQLNTADWQMGQVRVNQQQDSHFEAHAVELGGAKVRMDISADLQGEGAFCRINGLFLSDGTQHVDHHVHMAHSAPHCTSRQGYRSVLSGHSHGVYNGAVHVRVGASGTDAGQNSDNLLLSRTAEIDTKPALEIDHDNVKCAHGATVGQLDADHLFYLRSRGLSQAMSRDVLVFAFADTLLAALPSAVVRRYIEQQAFAKLPYGNDMAGLLGA
ncbi:MAG: Fe-S cluster assembly protein SufD [Mariprofundaceae bacterium]|nr:Fe-S cluster assembly protein SufD [Mariprofundaceae bacterium]